VRAFTPMPAAARRTPRTSSLSPALGTVLAALLLAGCATAAAPSDPSTTRSSTPAVATTAPAAADTAADVLGTLQVRGRAPMTGYDRDLFGRGWIDTDRNGCDTRNDVLAAHLAPFVVRPGTNGCVVEAGTLSDPYTGTSIDFVRGDGALVDVDHVVALGNGWVSGAQAWGAGARVAFANDPLNLLPVDAGQNRQKGDGDAATWLPADRSYRCAYVARQVAVKAKYELSVTPAERDAIDGLLDGCPDEPVPADSGLPTSTDVGVPAGGPSGTPSGGTPSYESCAAVRAAGAAPIRSGDPGYGRHLDGDGDGVACE